MKRFAWAKLPLVVTAAGGLLPPRIAFPAARNRSFPIKLFRSAAIFYKINPNIYQQADYAQNVIFPSQTQSKLFKPIQTQSRYFLGHQPSP
jgi:hypothetical protein